ncbi:MAG TPA: hypothetical protein VER76_00030, partial [Pyrinomonadaceae bacterium]|nr:hypothetical protein [Pyrinomonadaceae bacterium]
MSWKQKSPFLLIACVVLLGTVLAILPRPNKKAPATPAAQQPTAEMVAQSVPTQHEAVNVTKTETAPAVAANPATAAVAAPEARASERRTRAKAALIEAVSEATEPKVESERPEAVEVAEVKSDLRAKKLVPEQAKAEVRKEFVLRRDGEEIRVKKRQRKPGARFDKPAEAMKRYLKRRIPAGEKELPIDRYYTALAQIQEMPQYSTVLGKTVTRKAAERIGKPTTKTPATGKSIKGGRDVQPTLVGDQQAGV